MELSNPDKAAANAAKVLDWFRQNNKDNIFHVQHIASSPELGFFLPNTEGVELPETVLPLEHENIIVKNFPNSFLKTDLESKLKAKGVTKVVVVVIVPKVPRAFLFFSLSFLPIGFLST
ncbi:isochorismatase family protein [Neobacillus sp. C211]|uniref:isochorismatase family protein n=1 Tax=unclassified Neobacillus TaxID=2675272 RepID=UPI003979C618